MDINYLYSIIALYLDKETDDKKTNLNIVKQNNDELQFNFNMNEKSIEVTSFVLSPEIILDSNNLNSILQMYKQKYITIDESYEYDKETDLYNYMIKFNNGRKISFYNFTLIEVNNIRNVLYNIKIQKEEIRIVFEDEKKEKSFSLMLQQTGYVNYVMLILTTIGLVGVFVLSLWIFSNIIK